MQNPYSEFLAIAEAAARSAGQLALSLQNQLKSIQFKGEKDIVTEADFACDTLIRKTLTEKFPDHNLVTEEAANSEKGSPFTWYVDPVDGTVNYSRGLPLWGVSIGLCQDSTMIAGAIFLPALNEMYTATLGGGAYLNQNCIQTSSLTRAQDAIISHGDFNIGATVEEREAMNSKSISARARTASAVQRVKCMGSAVLEGAFVAAGRMDAYCMLAMKPWDVAVASLLVMEAGGHVSHLDGRSFSILGNDALFSNGLLHQDLLKILA